MRHQGRKSNTRVTFWVRSGVTDGSILLAEEQTIYVTLSE